MLSLITILVLLKSVAIRSQTLIGYDCGSHSLNVTTLSLLDVGKCDLPIENVEEKKIYLQLLQVNDYAQAKAIQCKIEIKRTIKHCRAFSFTKAARLSEGEYIQEVSAETCKQMHQTGVWARSVE